MGKTRAGRFALRGQRTALLHLETMTQAVDSADSVDPRALEALNRYFGYDSFRPGQSGIVSAILTGHDVLGVMPTGAGKSICYQIPAAILPGVAIVISPLISLMRDQVDALNDVGLPAAFINTTQTPDEQDLVFTQALSGQIKLLYVAPERLETERFRNFAVRVPISLVAVDEAHCVSQWGQDFRSSYLGIGEFIAGLPTRPTVAAFTATATERVRRDIVSILGLHTPSITVTGSTGRTCISTSSACHAKTKHPGWRPTSPAIRTNPASSTAPRARKRKRSPNRLTAPSPNCVPQGVWMCRISAPSPSPTMAV